MFQAILVSYKLALTTLLVVTVSIPCKATVQHQDNSIINVSEDDIVKLFQKNKTLEFIKINASSQASISSSRKPLVESINELIRDGDQLISDYREGKETLPFSYSTRVVELIGKIDEEYNTIYTWKHLELVRSDPDTLNWSKLPEEDKVFYIKRRIDFLKTVKREVLRPVSETIRERAKQLENQGIKPIDAFHVASVIAFL